MVFIVLRVSCQIVLNQINFNRRNSNNFMWMCDTCFEAPGNHRTILGLTTCITSFNCGVPAPTGRWIWMRWQNVDLSSSTRKTIISSRYILTFCQNILMHIRINYYTFRFKTSSNFNFNQMVYSSGPWTFWNAIRDELNSFSLEERTKIFDIR